MEQEIIPPTTALTIIAEPTKLVPAVIFSEGGSKDILDKLSAYVDSLPKDASTEEARKELTSIEYKLARTKTTLDKMGVTLKDEAQAIVDNVNIERKRIKTKMEELQTKAYKPVQDFKDREKIRTDKHESELLILSTRGDWVNVEPDAAQIRERIALVAAVSLDGWEEFSARAIQTKEDVLKSLGKRLDVREKYEADQAELARLRAAEEERERQLNETYQDAYRENAAFDAKRDSENKAAADTARVAQENAAAIKAEQDRLAAVEQQAADDAAAAAKALQDAEDKRVADLKTAKEKSDREQAAALQKQKDDAAAAQKAIDDAAAAQKVIDDKRAADIEHQGKINREVLAALMEYVDKNTDPALRNPEAILKAAIKAIANGRVTHVKINY